MREPAVSERVNTSSIELSRSAKGEYSWHIKNYYEGFVDADRAIDEVKHIDEALRDTFLGGGRPTPPLEPPF